MKEFEIEVRETFMRVVRVEEINEEDAIKYVMRDYNSKKIVLDSDDFFDVDFNMNDE